MRCTINSNGQTLSRHCHLKRHFGSLGVTIHQYARGVDERKVKLPRESKSINQQITFAKDTLDQRFLEANLYQLCQRIAGGGTT